MKNWRIIALGALLATAVWTLIIPLAVGNEGDNLKECGGLVIPKNAATRLVIDEEGGTLKIETDGPSILSKEGIRTIGEPSVTINYNEQECKRNSSVKAEIDRALKVVADTRTGDCASMREFIAEGRTTSKGELVNLEAGKLFLEKKC